MIPGDLYSCTRKILSNFRSDQAGTVFAMSAITLPVILGATLAALEYSEAANIKSDIRNKLDAAAIVATRSGNPERTDPSGELDVAGSTFFLNSIKASEVRATDITVDFGYDAERDFVWAEATYTPKTTTNTLPFGKTTLRSEVKPRRPAQLELALALDLSGSMNWAFDGSKNAPTGARRIDGLRDAFRSMMTGIETDDRLEARVAVVPFSSMVDIGNLFFPKVAAGQASKFKHYQDAYTLEDAGLFDSATTYPDGFVAIPRTTPDGFPAQQGVWATERARVSASGGPELWLAPPGSGAEIPIRGQFGFKEQVCLQDYIRKYGSKCVNISSSRPNGNNSLLDIAWFAPRTGVLPLSSTSAAADFVDSLEPMGSTSGALVGTEWALNMLNPQWHDFIQHPTGAPSAFSGETAKAIVVMTDGVFNGSFAPAIKKSGSYEGPFQFFDTICDFAKDQDVTVFTVALSLGTNSNDDEAKAALRKCAGAKVRYFDVETKDDLVSAFKDIAASYKKMRVSG